jgi:hypothetical protein
MRQMPEWCRYRSAVLSTGHNKSSSARIALAADIARASHLKTGVFAAAGGARFYTDGEQVNPTIAMMSFFIRLSAIFWTLWFDPTMKMA